MHVPAPTPPLRSDAATPRSLSTFLSIEHDRNQRAALCSVVSAPNENRAREIAVAAARASGREFVDLLTPALMRQWLDRAESQPPDLVSQ